MIRINPVRKVIIHTEDKLARMESTESGTVFRKAIMKSRNQPIVFLRTSSAGDWFKFSQICVDQSEYSTPKQE
jgi:hypothetical protein